MEGCASASTFFLRDLGHIGILILVVVLLGAISAVAHGAWPKKVFAATAPEVVLPFKVVVDEESSSARDGIALPPKDYSNHVGPGLQGALTLGILNLVHAARIKANEENKFPAGAIFESAFRKVSFTGSESRPIVRAELVQCLPSLGEMIFGTKLFLDLKFKTSFSEIGLTTLSSYWFEYELKWLDDKHDVLGRMVELAIHHWVAEMLSGSSGKEHTFQSFPPEKEGTFKIDRGQCSYSVFSTEKNQHDIIEEDLMPGIELNTKNDQPTLIRPPRVNR